jgi:hypothetical protein
VPRDLRLHSAARFLLALVLSIVLIAALAAAPGTAATKPRSGDAVKREGARIGLSHNASVNGKDCRWRRIAPRGKQSSRGRRHARPRWRCLPRRASASTTASGPLYWGAWISDQLTGGQAPWDMSAVSAFEGMTQKPLSLIQFAAPFADCSHSPCSFYDFPAKPMDNIRGHGAIPFFSWSSQSTPSSLNQPDFQLSDVISGVHDSYIRRFAEDARDWGHPFFLRFNWEMNGGWFSWSEGVNGNQSGEYVAAWRHVHDIFAEVGATNATWVWCPNVDPTHRLQDLAPLYPGDEYVDWTGLDGYNWGTNPARPDRWRSFDQLYRSTYDLITETIAPSKPLIVSEVGSTEYGGSKASWIEDMLSTVPVEYPKIRGLLWFEKFDDGMDWPLETSSDAVNAFASGIQNPAYVGNQYGNLSANSIPVAG